MLIDRRKVGNASREEKIDSLLAIQKTDFKVLGQYGRFLCVPFYSVRDKKVCHLPYFIYSNLYASNGMCAGNTMSEALIQGISEIMERYINNRELSEMVSLPDIPEDFIAKYTEVYKIYTSIKDDDRYIIHMKDASLGGLFPVACLLVTEKNSGKCGVKFGAHPNIGIAMERTFTESVQGESLIQFSRKGEISFFNENVGNASNFINSFRTSDAQYPYQILHNPSQYRYHEFKQNNSLTNDEHLKLELQRILDMGLDVLVNDCSYLGFPSYHIIIPGISEIGIFSDSYLNSTLEHCVDMN